ncbi:efflux RND transporter periplasmic adaptor subunit [Robiginitalea sp. M366]|uniref:efflux RND transporter periplasmic adaptor subunit n=1 Tax=Robiginitalea aestuariiviva TaxID=3036903 RepID=UPI00240E3A10|nr:efflux RND transporter periplasmic adaptor subunit [Robiginitalea aestuariiviva]MDG1572444.1 efflux RND transporter periplasmic adaptor subunit [Robiginitalea aestuariiviva]
MKPQYTIPLSGLLCLGLLAGCGKKDNGITPEVQDITEAVYASVTIQPDSMYRVYASVGGILEQNLVQEGDTVMPGDALVQIAADAPERYRENARLQMEWAADQYKGEASPLRDLASRIRLAELTYRDDSLNYDRQRKLWAQQIGSRATLEARQLAYERSQSQLEQLRSEYQRKKQELHTAMVQAENQFRASQSDAAQFRLRSKIRGRVYALYNEPGEGVSPSQPLAMVGSPDTFLAELLVDEVDIVRLRPGQDVVLSLDAYQDTVFQGFVARIYPEKDARNQTFRVEARFNTPPAVLFPGMSGEANIIVATRTDVLTIPRNYLVGADSVRTAAGLKKVSLGLQTLDRVEVREGLEANTRILKPDP